MTKEALHSEFGPSSAERWLACPGSVAASRGKPDKDSEWALFGSAGHALAEWSRDEGRPAKTWLGTKIPVRLVAGGVTEIEVTAEMANGVQEFVDYVEALGGHQLNESRIYYDQYVAGGFGTLDAAALFPGLCIVVDLKMGVGKQVYAPHNPQLMIYALGLLLEWDFIFRFETFRLVISQPRLDHLDEWEISRDDLLAWAMEVLVPGYRATLEPDAKFEPGKHCQFCRIKATCRARAEKTFTVLMDEFEDLDSVAIDRKRTDEITIEELAEVRKHFPAIKSWMAAADARLYDVLKLGERPGGLKLVPGHSDRAFAEMAAQALQKKGLKKADLFEPAKMRTPAAVEKLKPEYKKFFAPATKTKPAGELHHLIVKPKGKLTIAEATDKRDAVNLIDLETEFDDLTEGNDTE